MGREGTGFWQRLVIAVLAIGYAAVVLLAKTHWNAASLVFFCSTILFFLYLFVRSFVVYRSGGGAVVFSTVESVINVVCLLVQIILFGIIGVSFAEFDYAVSLIAEVVFCVLMALLLIAVRRTAAVSGNEELHVQNTVRGYRLAIAALSSLQTDNPEIRRKVDMIVKAYQSDFPVYPKELSYIDAEIMENVDQVGKKLLENEEGEAMSILERVDLLVQERSRKAPIYR